MYRIATVKKIMAVMLLTTSSTAVLAQTEDTKKTDKSTTEVGDIVVTATRDETLLSKTPVAVSAVTDEQLRELNITTAIAVADITPNIAMTRSNGGLQINIRGVTSYDLASKGDASSAFFVDGIYIARRQAQETSFLDVQRVEVLRGPQGTLFGRNATGGVFQVITAKPTSEFSAGGTLTYGNYDTLTGEGYVNVPLGEKAAFRLSAGHDQRDSFLKSSIGEDFGTYRKNTSFRGQVLLTPTPELDVRIQGDYALIKGNNFGVIPQENFYSFVNPNDPRVPIPKDASADAKLTVPYDLPPGRGLDNRNWGFGTEVNWVLGPVTATYLGQYRQYEGDENNVFVREGLAQPLRNVSEFTQNSHELRFKLNDGGALKLQVGAFYFKENNSTYNYLDQRQIFNRYVLNTTPVTAVAINPVTNLPTPTVFAPGTIAVGTVNPAGGAPLPLAFAPGTPVPAQTALRTAVANQRNNPFNGSDILAQTATSYAFFGQATYSLTETFRVTGGIRYSNDKKFQDGLVGGQPANVVFNSDGVFNPVVIPSQLAYANYKSDKITWRAGLEYDFTDDIFAFATVSTGYKAGGYNNGCGAGAIRSATGLTTCANPRPDASLYYKPETITSYEGGVKAGLLDNSVRLNLTGFYYDYKNLQLFKEDTIAAAPLLIFNAGKARTYGLELETTARITPAFTVRGSFTYLNAKYNSQVIIPVAGPNPSVDFDGKPLDNAPEFSASMGASYRYPIGEGNILASVNTRLKGTSYIGDYNNGFQFKQPSFTKTDLSLTYNAPDNRWDIGAFVKNIENSVEVSYIAYGPYATKFSAPQLSGATLATGGAVAGDPRTYGIRVGFKF
jgi:iron complex outermembrane recepter protein